MSTPAHVRVRAPEPHENAWIERYLSEAWGSTTVGSRGVAHDASQLPAFVAVDSDEIVGLATFRFGESECGLVSLDGVRAGQPGRSVSWSAWTECELVSLDALHQGQGIGSALLARLKEDAAGRGCRRLWLITTNDN